MIMTEKYYKYSTHHKCCRSKWWTNEKDNLVKLKVVHHRALHTIFQNDTTIEKIRRILQMDATVIQWDFKRDIERILDLYDWLEYHSHVINNK
jgi:hypothetical protein